MEKKDLSIHEIQQLIEGKSKEEVGVILSSSPAGNWCGIWYDWFCHDSKLPKEASKFTQYIRSLKGDWTKTHYVWLKNNCPGSGALYTDIRISPMEKNTHYNVGYSLGNGTTRERQVFDTRKGDIVYHSVKNYKQAAELVNKLLG